MKKKNTLKRLQSGGCGTRFSRPDLTVVDTHIHTSLAWERGAAAVGTIASWVCGTISAGRSRSTAETSTLRWVYTAGRWRTSFYTCESHWGPSLHPRDRDKGTKRHRERADSWSDSYLRLHVCVYTLIPLPLRRTRHNSIYGPWWTVNQGAWMMFHLCTLTYTYMDKKLKNKQKSYVYVELLCDTVRC